MNYLQWNNLLGSYFFNAENNDKEIFLYITKDEIINLAKQSDAESFEIEEGKVIEQVIWDDFTLAIRNGLPGSNGNIINKTLDAYKRRNSLKIDSISIDIPPYFGYLIAFILPLTEGEDDLNANAYYDRLNAFLNSNNILLDHNIGTQSFKLIDECWEALSIWANIDRATKLGIYNVKNYGNHVYVGKPFAECIITSKQRKRFPELFSEEDLRPDDQITESTIINILQRNGKAILRYNESKWNTVINNETLKKLLVTTFKDELVRWTGETDEIVENNDDRRYQNKKLVLCLDYNTLNNKIEIKHFRAYIRVDFPEEIYFNENLKVFEIENGYSSPIPIDELSINLDEDTSIRSSSSRKSFVWKTKDLYIFRKNHGKISDWIQIEKIDTYCKNVLIVFKNRFRDKLLDNWKLPDVVYRILDDNERSNLPNGWSAIYINGDIRNNQHPELPELKLDPELKARIVFNKEFYFNGCFYKDCLPNVWIENQIEVKPVFARYDSGEELELNLEEFELYSFTQQHIQRDERFKLISGEIESHNYIQIKDFTKLDNDSIEELLPKRDILGRITQDSEYIRGNELFLSPDKVKSLAKKHSNSLLYNFFNANIDIGIYGDYLTEHKGNLLLHYISEKGSLTPTEFKEIVAFLSNDENINNIAKNLRYRLQDLGYIDFNTSSGVVTITKPQAVIAHSDKGGIKLILTGARDSTFIARVIKNLSEEAEIVISDFENILLPQKIEIHFATKNPVHLRELLNEQLNILFQKNNINLQSALCELVDDIDLEYFSPANAIIASISGGEIFDLESLKFIPKPEQFDKGLSLVKVDRINGYKTYYTLWYEEEAYEIPERQIGIFILIWLKNNMSLDQNSRHRWVEQFNHSPDRFINLISYDGNNNLLSVPLECSLPKYVTIAVSLLSGEAPLVRYVDGRNQLIYKNVDYIFANNLVAMKLNQVLIRRNIQI